MSGHSRLDGKRGASSASADLPPRLDSADSVLPKARPIYQPQSDLPQYRRIAMQSGRREEARGGYVAAMTHYLEAAAPREARRLLREARVEVGPARARFLRGLIYAGSADPQVRLISAQVLAMLPLLCTSSEFKPWSPRESLGSCGTYSRWVRAGLAAQNTAAEWVNGGLGRHFSLKSGAVIVDASILQFLRHPKLGGIFIGTQEDLARLVADKRARLVNLPGCSKKQALELLWDIRVA